MKTLLRLAYFAILYGLLNLAAPAATAAPYFHIAGNHGETSDEQFPLKSSAAKVEIDGTIARVRLTQRYGNAGSVPIEAVYVFPASTRAAVHGMTLTSGGHVIAARIRESAKAKAEYETAKTEKKSAALLEEHRPNVFQMSVANLLPGDDVTVEVEWTETIPALDATYEFVFPTVVGPRYAGGPSQKQETWSANPYLKDGARNPATISIDVTLGTTLPLAEVTCPSHPVVVDFKAKDRATVKIDTREGKNDANRDFILRWKLGGDRVDAGLLLHQGDTTNHFLLQIEPPKRVTPGQIPPRDYVMILDVSGSMSGFPLDTAKALLRDLVHGLKPTDTFNVLCFASGTGLLSDTPMPASEENLDRAKRFIDGQNAGGGTELAAALQRSFSLPGGDDRSRSILLVTDGFITADAAVRDLIRSKIGSANLFAFGIGSSVNRGLIEATARAGGGEPTIVTTTAEAGPAAKRFLDAISNPVLTKIRIESEGVTLGNLEPAAFGDVFGARPLVIIGTWTGEPTGAIILKGIAGDGAPFEKKIDLAEAAARGLEHPALPVLWARERVRRLTEQSDKSAESVREITSLGIAHSLLTPYTAFVAVDETPRVMDQVAKTVKQPLPLPLGVTEAAVGSVGGGTTMVSGASVPEPGAIGLISLLVVLLALQRRR